MSWMKIIGLSIVGVIVLFAIGFVTRGFGLVQESFWAPKEQQVKREVFEQTQSYTEGKRQDAAKWRFQYETATDSLEQKAIRGLVIDAFANVGDGIFEDDSGRLNSSGRFIKAMKDNGKWPSD